MPTARKGDSFCVVMLAKCRASQPEVILLMPCGFDLDRSKEDIPTLTALPGWNTLPAVQARRAYVMDAAAYTSRLGPRLVTGLEMMAELIHNQCSGGAGVSLWAGPDVVRLKAITVTDSPAVVGVFFFSWSRLLLF